MKDFFIEMYIEPLSEGFSGIMLALFMWVISLFLTMLLMWGSLYLVDSVGLDIQYGRGEVTEREFIPAHTTTTMVYNAATKTSIPQVNHYPDAWYLTIKVNKVGLSDTVEVTYESFINQHKGDDLEITYSNGRIWDSVYIKSFK